MIAVIESSVLSETSCACSSAWPARVFTADAIALSASVDFGLNSLFKSEANALGSKAVAASAREVSRFVLAISGNSVVRAQRPSRWAGKFDSVHPPANPFLLQLDSTLKSVRAQLRPQSYLLLLVRRPALAPNQVWPAG